MRHWYREQFSTHQFFADLLFHFERTYPDDELDLMEPDRDRHGYDCVLIRRTKTKLLTRYVQLKSTEKANAKVTNIHSSMLLDSYREIVQVRVSPAGKCEYYVLSDIGRLVYLALSAAHDPTKAALHETEIKKALFHLLELMPGASLPKLLGDITPAWAAIDSSTLEKWDKLLLPATPRLWRKVIQPFIDIHTGIYPRATEKTFNLNPCWTRKILPEDLLGYLFRGTEINSAP
jgi:hypothetical protein